MSDFDPDKYLEQSADGFDPDAYLAKVNPSEKEGAGQAFLEHYGNTATLGYLPHLQAGLEQLMPNPTADIDEELRSKGFNIQQDEPSYIKSRDESIKRLAQQSKDFPKASSAGDLTGIVGSALISGKIIPMSPAAATLTGRFAQAAKTGAAMGALANPGDHEGEFSPVQPLERGINAGLGALGGVVAQGAVEGTKFTGGKIADWFRAKAAEKTEKAAGFVKKHTTKAELQNKTGAVGNVLLDEGIVTPWATPKKIAERLERKLGEKFDEIDNIITSSEDVISKLSPEKKSELLLQPEKLGEELKASLKAKYPGVPEAKLQPAYDEIDSWLAGQQAKSIKAVQESKKSMNRFLKDSDFYKTPTNIAKEGTLAVRRGFKDSAEKQANAAAEILGKEANKLKETNRIAGALMEAEDAVTDKIARDAANRTFSLTDTIVGGAGLGLGGITGAVQGGDLDSALKGAAMGASLAGVNKFGRTFGPSLMATGSRSVANALSKLPRFAAMAEKNQEALQTLAAQLTSKMRGGPKFEHTPETPLFNNPKLMQMLKDNPDLVDRIQDERLRAEAKKRVQRMPSRNPAKEPIVNEEEARNRFIQSN